MRYDREPWRKLYTAESVEHRMMPLLSRGLRDYLLRHAKDDGTILPSTTDPGGDLARALGAHVDEREQVARYVQAWIDDGFLALRRYGARDALVIRNFAKAQKARSKAADRQKRYRSKKKAEDGVTRYATGDVTGDVTDGVTVTGVVTPSRAPARVSSLLISSSGSGSAPEGVQREPDESKPDPKTPHAIAANWQPWANTAGTLEMTSGIPGWAVVELAKRFVAHFALDPAARATAVGWQQRFAKWAQKDWSDPVKRPTKPEPTAAERAARNAAADAAWEALVARESAERAGKAPETVEESKAAVEAVLASALAQSARVAR